MAGRSILSMFDLLFSEALASGLADDAARGEMSPLGLARNAARVESPPPDNFFLIPTDLCVWTQIQERAKKENMVIVIEVTNNVKANCKRIQQMFMDMAREFDGIPFLRVPVGPAGKHEELRKDVGGVKYTPTIVIVWYGDSRTYQVKYEGEAEIRLVFTSGQLRTSIMEFTKRRAKFQRSGQTVEESAGYVKTNELHLNELLKMDLDSAPTREIKAIMTKMEISTHDCFERGDLKTKLIENVPELKLHIERTVSVASTSSMESDVSSQQVYPQSSTLRKIPFTELEFGDSLGKGGSGSVFKGEWKTKSLSVAIKRVIGNIRDEEAEILSKLSHRNVITFYGICVDKYPEYFIITEIAEGGSLYGLIHVEHYHPKLEESLQWAKEIAEGMRYLHQQKVIHRDLKSPNVLVTTDMTMKLCDFGSAKEFDHTTKQTGTGTYRWIAPEVLQGEKVSLSCDVFSYGMVLYEIFKQEMPFVGFNEIKVATMILDGKIPATPVFLEPYLTNLMKCCWQMNPKDRPTFQDILFIMEKKECSEPATQGTTVECPDPASQGTTDDVPLTPNDLPRLQTVLEEASMVWYPLGMKLNLDTETLTGIAKAAGNDSTTALTFVLTRWLKSKHRPPLLQSLTTSLCSPEIGQTRLSDTLLKIKHQFGQ